MTVEQIKEMISKDEKYSFLNTNPHLENKIMFLTLGGSYAYGTNVETSDVDIRGCALNSRFDILGLSSFEQVVDAETDTTIYAFNKLIKLLMDCNPNTIELLGCKPEHYFMISPVGQQLIDNQKLFLSQRAVRSFGGYATQQLRRLENAIARDALPQARKEEHIRQSMESALEHFKNSYSNFPYGNITLYTDISDKEEFDREVFADINLTHYPAREFNALLNNMTDVLGCYDKLNKRNRKKDEAHLNKHAMHLIRLYLMCIDILEKEKVITYRENDRDFLLEIRNGKYMNADGSYKDEFFEMVNDFEKRLDYAKQNTSLPEKPDYTKIQSFVMDVNQFAVDKIFY